MVYEHHHTQMHNYKFLPCSLQVTALAPPHLQDGPIQS